MPIETVVHPLSANLKAEIARDTKGSTMGVVSKYRNEVEKEELEEYCDLQPKEQDEQTD